MELQYLLVRSVGPSGGLAFPLPDCSFIDIPSGRVRTFGRSSPELHWCAGNDAHCSRRHMSVAPVPALPGVEVRCLGKNPLAVARRAEELPQRVHRGEAVTLRAGDCVGVTERAWFVVVIARVRVTGAAADAPRVWAESPSPSSPHLSSASQQPLPPSVPLPLPLSVPLVTIGAPWPLLPRATRAAIAHSAAQCQCPRYVPNGPNGPSGPSGPNVPNGPSGPNGPNGLHSPSGPSGRASGSSGTRGRRRQRTPPSGASAKRMRLSPARSASTQPQPAPPTDTYDEGFDEVLCALESHTAAFDRVVAAPQALLGDSPPPCGARSQQRRAPAVMVRRAQLQQNAAEAEADATAPPRMRPVSDESQVVYYRH